LRKNIPLTPFACNGTDYLYTKKGESMPYTEKFKLELVAEYEAGGISMEALKRKYGIGGNTTVAKWIKRYGKEGAGAISIITKIDEHIEKTELIEELEAARLKIAALEALVEISSKRTGINLKKKFGGKL
jgi:transposase